MPPQGPHRLGPPLAGSPVSIVHLMGRNFTRCSFAAEGGEPTLSPDSLSALVAGALPMN